MNALLPFACPRCGTALAPAPRDLVDRGASLCAQCGGVFLEDIKSYRDVESVLRPVVFEWRRVPSKAAQQEPLPCPRCGVDALMLKNTSERDRHVTVDVCARCGGAWLDGGELDAVQRESLPQMLRTLARWIAEA